VHLLFLTELLSSPDGDAEDGEEVPDKELDKPANAVLPSLNPSFFLSPKINNPIIIKKRRYGNNTKNHDILLYPFLHTESNINVHIAVYSA
tara:strand:- start:814 stop:1086 length:273 start_codon:yes stop_codon:yes gene_type:complete